MYIGILIVPLDIKNQLFNDLMTSRCGNKPPNNWSCCKKNCPYHSKNGIEIHYQELRSMNIYFIAKKWTNYFINDKKKYLFLYVGNRNYKNQ